MKEPKNGRSSPSTFHFLKSFFWLYAFVVFVAFAVKQVVSFLFFKKKITLEQKLNNA